VRGVRIRRRWIDLVVACILTRRALRTQLFGFGGGGGPRKRWVGGMRRRW